MQTFYTLLKLLHVFGFIATLGVTLANLIVYKRFWRLYDANPEQGLAAFRASQAIQVAGGLGLLTLILTGVGMLAILDWSFTSLMWFQIKLGLIVMIFVNGFTLGRTSTLKLQALIDPKREGDKNPASIQALRRRLHLFYSLQLSIFATIVLLSIFRFS